MLGDLLYESRVKTTQTVEFGMKFEDAVRKPPAGGARFDVHSEGEVVGGRISGGIRRVDYFYMRPDGLGVLHLHEVITTREGDNIAVEVLGLATAVEGGGFRVRGMVRFHTSSERYAWINGVQGVSEGVAEPSGEMRIKVYEWK